MWIVLALQQCDVMRSELTIGIFATQILFDWMVDWSWPRSELTIGIFAIQILFDWMIDWSWPRSVWLLYQLHVIPVPWLWSMLFTIVAGGTKTPSLWYFARVVLAMSIKHFYCSFTANRQQCLIQTNTSFCSSFSHASLTKVFLSSFFLFLNFLLEVN